jgi:hypothetical protein
MRYGLDFGAGKTGLTPAFSIWKRLDTLADLSTPPTITEVTSGDGWYYFDYDWSAAPTGVHNVIFRVSAGGVSLGATLKDQDQLFNTGYIDAAVTGVKGASNKDLSQVDTDVLAVKTKTDNLPATPASQSDVTSAVTSIKGASSKDLSQVDTDVLAVKSQTDNLPATPAAQADVTSAQAAIMGASSKDLTQVDTDVLAVKAKTDNLPAAPATTGDVTSAVTSINSNTSTLAADIKAQTDLIPAAPASSGDVSGAVASLKGASSKDLSEVFSQIGSSQTVVTDALGTAESGIEGAITTSQEVITTAIAGVKGTPATDLAAISGKLDSIEGVGFGTGDDLHSTKAALDSVASGLGSLGTASGTLTDIKAKTDLIPSDFNVWLSSVKDNLTKVLGLCGENVQIEDTDFDARNNLISGKIRIYPTRNDAINKTNPIAVYSITGSYIPNTSNLQQFSKLKDP